MRSTYNGFRQNLGMYRSEGKQAIQNGLEKDDNPYDYGTDAYKLWLRGWEIAEAGND